MATKERSHSCEKKDARVQIQTVSSAKKAGIGNELITMPMTSFAQPVAESDYAELPTEESLRNLKPIVVEEDTLDVHPEPKVGLCDSPRDRMYLFAIWGSLLGQMFLIDKEELLIGRSATCDIVVVDNDISRHHARLCCTEDRRLRIIDLESTNGSYVDGERISEYLLQDGERFKLGQNTIFKFVLHDKIEEQLQRNLYESAVFDGLTQIHNRKFFNERLSSELHFAKRHEKPFAVLLIDIDRFKQINDAYGHPFGDIVLQQVAQSLKGMLRREDIVARYGGEEFAVLTRESSKEQALLLAERIRKLIAALRVELPSNAGSCVSLTVSIGVIVSDGQDTFDMTDVIEQADRRLYRAKSLGRNCVIAALEPDL